MRPEAFDRTVTLQRATTTQNEYGEEVQAWADLGTVQAKSQPVSDGEKLSAGEVSSTLSARFTIRYDSAWADFSAKDRLVFEGETFDVWGAKPVGRRDLIEITAAARSE